MPTADGAAQRKSSLPARQRAASPRADVEGLEARRLMAAGVAVASRAAVADVVLRAQAARHSVGLRIPLPHPPARGNTPTASPANTPGALTGAVPASPAAQQQAPPLYDSVAFDMRTGRESFTIHFTEDFTLSDDDVFVANADTGAALPFVLRSYDPTTHTATFAAAAGVATVPDGWYVATLRAAGVIDSAGRTMAQRGAGDVVAADFALLGDTNRDGAVGPADYNTLAGHFGQTGQTSDTGDFDRDGAVGAGDFNLLAGRFGKQLPPTPPTSNVPRSMRVDASSGAPYVDSINRAFDAGAGFVGGEDRSAAGAYDVGGSGFADDALLLLTYRAGADFTFARPMINGHYALFLEFAEPNPNAAAGERTFDVSAEGQLVLDDYDITADAGPRNAIAKKFDVTVIDGWLDLSFHGVVGEAVVGAIVLIPTDIPASAVPYLDVSAYTDPTQQFVAEQRWLAQSDINLRRIGLAISFYMNEHRGHFPADLKALFDGGYYLDYLAAFANPRVPAALPRGELSGLEGSAWVSQQDGYVYVAAGLRLSTTTPQTIVAFDNPDLVASDTLSVLYADTHVGRLPRAQIVAQFGGAPTPPAPLPRPLDIPRAPTIFDSQQRLGDISVALQDYSHDHHFGSFPSDLASLAPYADPAIFVNPRGTTPAPPPNMTPEQSAEWIKANSDYVYAGHTRRPPRPFGQTPLVYEDPAKLDNAAAAAGVWVLFWDLHWEFRDPTWLAETLARPRG